MKFLIFAFLLMIGFSGQNFAQIQNNWTMNDLQGFDTARFFTNMSQYETFRHVKCLIIYPEGLDSASYSNTCFLIPAEKPQNMPFEFFVDSILSIDSVKLYWSTVQGFRMLDKNLSNFGALKSIEAQIKHEFMLDPKKGEEARIAYATIIFSYPKKGILLNYSGNKRLKTELYMKDEGLNSYVLFTITRPTLGYAEYVIPINDWE